MFISAKETLPLASMRERLKKLREAQNITQEEMATLLGIGKSALSKKENGKIKFGYEEVEIYANRVGAKLTLIIDLEKKN